MSTLSQLAKIVTKYGLKEASPANTVATITGNSTRASSETANSTRAPRATLVTPETFAGDDTGSTKVNKQQKRDIQSIERADTVRLLKENESLIGKGSKFHRRIVQDMLSPFRETHPFRRLEINDNSSYDVKKAQTMYKLKTDIQKNPTFRKTEDEFFLREVLPLLEKLTPPTAPPPLHPHKYHYPLRIKNSIHERDRKPFDSYIYPRDTHSEIPPIPNLQNDPTPTETLIKYTGLLTHTKFHFKNSSSRVGIIPLLLRTLTHPKNESVRPYLSTEVFDNLLWYFGSLHTHDMAAVRETLSFMKISGCSPSTRSYNFVIRALLTRFGMRATQSVSKKLVYYLGEMFENKVYADEMTWNLVWMFLKSESARVFMWRRMGEFGFKLDLYNLVSRMEFEPDGIDSIVETILLQREQISKGTLKIIIRKLLEREQFNTAWVLMKRFIASGRPIDYTVMDVFLATFASRGRLDLTLLVFNTLVNDYNVKPGISSFNLLFKSLVWNGYFKNFPVVYEYLKTLKVDFGLGYKDSYWKLKAESIAKFNCTKIATVDEISWFRLRMTSFKFARDDELSLTTMDRRKVSHERIKMLRYLNCVPYRRRNLARPKGSEAAENGGKEKKPQYIVTSDEIKEEKRKFRSRIKRIAIQNATVKRIPYARDWFGALNDELESRGIIVKPESKETVGQ